MVPGILEIALPNGRSANRDFYLRSG